MENRRESPLGAELVGWLPLVGLLLMLVNDLWLKPRWPGWATGKLSDLGLMLYLPFLLTATSSALLFCLDAVASGVSHGRWRVPYRLGPKRLLGAVLLTGSLFAAIKLFVAASRLFVTALETLDVFQLFGRFRNTADPTDCLALLLLPVAWWWGQRFAVRTERQ